MPIQQKSHFAYPKLYQSDAYRIAKRRDENPNLVRKLFDDTKTTIRNKDAFLASRQFINALCSIIDEYKSIKIREFEVLDYTKMVDDSAYTVEHEYKFVISQYEKASANLKDIYRQNFEAKDVTDLQQKEAAYNPIKFTQILNESKNTLTETVFMPLRNVQTENSFIHSLKMLISNFAEKLGFGKKGYHFFKPKPTFHPELHNIVENTRNIEIAVKDHLGIV